MDSGYLQNLRYKLEKRVKRLESAGDNVFHFILEQFWGFLQSYPIFVGIFEDLAHRCPEMESRAKDVIGSKGKNLKNILPPNELEYAALSYFVIKKCVESNKYLREYEIEMSLRSQRIGIIPRSPNEPPLKNFSNIFLKPFYEYLDEHIDDQRVILALLNRYQHKCEWFQHDDLIKRSKRTRQKEAKLKKHLFEYLHDQGLDIIIEPKSASGEADFIGIGDDKYSAEVKIFNGKYYGKKYIVKGFRQAYDYAKDHNVPFGYLIIYKTCERELKFDLNQSQSTPFVNVSNKTIFLIAIDIFPYENPASKRGTLRTIEITKEDLIKEIK